jgi:hypothetical protein
MCGCPIPSFPASRPSKTHVFDHPAQIIAVGDNRPSPSYLFDTRPGHADSGLKSSEDVIPEITFNPIQSSYGKN